MTYLEALEVVVARTRHERYRWLCSDENPNTEQREGYRRIVLEKAGQPAPAPAQSVPLSTSLRAARLGFRQCFYSSHEGCGCSGTHCFYKGRIVELRECVECLGGDNAAV